MITTKKFLVCGQSLFEIVMAVGLVAAVAVAVVSLSTNSVRNSSLALNKSQSNRYAQEADEWLKSEKGKGWDYFKNLVDDKKIPGFPEYANYCFNTLNWATSASCPGKMAGSVFVREGYFTCRVDSTNTPTDCSLPAVDNIEVTVRVYWDDSTGRQETDVTSLFTRGKSI